MIGMSSVDCTQYGGGFDCELPYSGTNLAVWAILFSLLFGLGVSLSFVAWQAYKRPKRTP